MLLLTGVASSGQHNYPKGYFIFPINPGQVNYLAANMGELRSNHFHGGMDIKTGGKVGYKVYASAEGYVVRIKISATGYGNAVYIRHPNNLVTVYAHLDKFNTAIGNYIRKKQYENQSFEVDVYPDKNDLPIKKKEVIGLSGNSGSSQGPHLHYEIRDTTDRVLNPANFGFTEIYDNIRPIVDRVAISTFDLNSRVNNEFGRQEFKAIKTATAYSIPKVYAHGWIGLELKAFDKKNSVRNSFGISNIQVFLDEKEIFRHDMNTFTFEETRHINTHLNYPVFSNTGRRFERLYVADGNSLTSYHTGPSSGKIFINDDLLHKVKIKVTDDFNNESTLAFDIQGKIPAQPTIPSNSSFPNQKLTTEVLENTLKISTQCVGDPGAQLFFRGTPAKLDPAYSKNGQIVYLHDLRKGLPDSLSVGNQKEIFNFIKMIPSGTKLKLTFDKISLSVPPLALADTMYLEYKKEIINNFQVYDIHNSTVPLFDSIWISMVPSENIANKSRTFMYSVYKGKLSFEGGEWKGDKIEVKTRNLGRFTLIEDTIKPSIKLISSYNNSVRFNVTDDLSGIKSFRANLDGYWVLMNYDYKRRLLWSERLDKTVPLKGKFELEVTDNAGNINNFSISL